VKGGEMKLIYPSGISIIYPTLGMVEMILGVLYCNNATAVLGRCRCKYVAKLVTCNYIKHYHGANQEQIQENIENGRPWNYGISFSQQSKEKMKKTKKHRYSLGLYTKFNTKHSQETKDKISKSKIGKKLTQEHKDKISKDSSGRTWIFNNNLKKRKFVKKEEIDFYLQTGWEKGQGSIWVNNMIESISIDSWDYPKYIQKGFVNGRIQKLC